MSRRFDRETRHIEQCMPDYLAFLAQLKSADSPETQESASNDEQHFETSPDLCRLQKYARDWISRNVGAVVKSFPPTSSRCPASVKHEDCKDYSLYIGVGGNAYLHWKLAKFYELEKRKEKVDLHRKYAVCAVELALRMLPSKYSQGEEIAFYMGSAGVLALAAVVYWMTGHLSKTETQVNKLLDLMPSCLSPKAPCEVLYGRAGYLYSLLFVKKHIAGEAVERLGLDRVAKEVFEATISEGKRSVRGHDERVLRYSFMDTDYLGAGHGTIGILFVLLQFPDWCRDPAHKPWIIDTVDHIMSLQSPDGNFPVTMSDKQYHLYHWCHGAPGVVYTLYHAHKVLGEDKSILRSLDSALRSIWEKGLLKKGFGVCHGIAGNGYAFLMMHKHTGADEYLYAAYKMAEVMEKEEVKREISLFEDRQRFKSGIPDFPYSLMEGLGGTICYYCDLLHPEMAAFPGYDGDIA